MERIRGFEKVSKYTEGVDMVPLPRASTTNSAGYDFFALHDVKIPSFKNTKNCKPTRINLGVKAYMQPGEVLLLFNRSSNPTKFNLVQANSVGVIDADYYNNPDNEGEIAIEFYNMGENPIHIRKGQKICQGMFTSYLRTDDDNRLDATREGGLGSTGE